VATYLKEKMMTLKLEDITKEIEATPELATQLKQALLTTEDLTAAVEKKDPKVMPMLDRMVTQAIQGFQEKGMVAILDTKKEEWKKEHFDEFAKANNITVDPVIKEMNRKMADIEARLAKETGEKNKSVVQATVTASLAGKKIDPGFASFITGSDVESATAQADKFITLFDTAVNARVNEMLKTTTTAPRASGGADLVSNPFSKKTINLTQQQEIYRADPEKAKALMAQAAAE